MFLLLSKKADSRAFNTVLSAKVRADEPTVDWNREQLVIVIRFFKVVNGEYTVREDLIRWLDLFQELKTEKSPSKLHKSNKTWLEL